MPGDLAAQALVVDDSPLILMHSTAMLEDVGFDPLTAHTAEQAMAILEAHGERITLLFTDVQLPPGVMDGFELARWTAERWPSIGILVASGEVSPKPGDLPDGAHFVAKPFSAAIVYERLHQIVPEDRKPPPLMDFS